MYQLTESQDMEGQISAKLYISGFAEKYRAAWYEERFCLSRCRVEGLGVPQPLILDIAHKRPCMSQGHGSC